MKKIFTLLSLSISLSVFLQGDPVPNVIGTDIHGVPFNLHDELGEGRIVVLFVFGTGQASGGWSSGADFYLTNLLQDLNTEFGPTGSDKAVFVAYEWLTASDDSKLSNNIHGIDYTACPFPLINDPNPDLSDEFQMAYVNPSFGPGGVWVICPNDKTIVANFSEYAPSGPWVNGDNTQSYTNMQTIMNGLVATCVTLGTEETQLIEANVHPNPTADFATITVKEELKNNSTLEVYSVSGAKISTQTINTNASTSVQVDLTSLESGTYFVKVYNEKNSTKLLKIVKQ